MGKRLLLWALTALLSLKVLGQAAPSGAVPDLKSLETTLSDLLPVVKQPFLKKYMENLKSETLALGKNSVLVPDNLGLLRKEIANAGKLVADMKDLPQGSPWQKTPFICYVVPAISAVRRVPDSLPPDGKLEHQIEIVAAQGEFEPASFVIAPFADTAKFELKASELQGSKGKIPAGCVDIKLVKCWWQAGTAWNSYFADPTRRELVPELLLNDESLIKVDMERKEHYLRVDYPDGPEYVWISYQYPETPKIEREHRFDYFREPVADSPALLPVKLESGQAKQFWVTVKVPEKTPGGIYEGSISLSADGVPSGEIAVKLRVLPFCLPDPRTYYDLDHDFYSTMYLLGSLPEHLKANGNNSELAEKRLRALYKNQKAHNIYNYFGPDLDSKALSGFPEDKERQALIIRNLGLVKDAGFKAPLFAPFSASGSIGLQGETGTEKLAQYMKGAEEYLKITRRILGHQDVYAWGAGEPGRKTILAQMPGWEALHGIGVKISSEAQPRHFPIAGYAEDMVNMGGEHFTRECTAPWHALGQRVMSYASPHAGPENPALMRRTHGMMLYKAWFDGTCEMGWQGYRQNWLDFWNPYGYRITMVYPAKEGVIDTLHWEAFREGIDDIRYATKLKLLARDLIANKKGAVVDEAKKALLWLELYDEKSGDLNAMRLEMINYILKLNELL